MANNTSAHILNTSANLLGFCLFVLTSLHINNQLETHFIDVLTSSVALLLTISCIFSFTSIKTTNEKREQQLELIANYLFFAALLGILLIIILITVNFID